MVVVLFATNAISFNDNSNDDVVDNGNKDWVDYLKTKNIVVKASEYNSQNNECEFKDISLSFNDVKEIINELSSKKITKYYYGSFPPTGTICSDRYMLEYDGNRISLEASGYMWVNDDNLSNKIDLDVDNVDYAEGADYTSYVYKFDTEFKDIIDNNIKNYDVDNDITKKFKLDNQNVEEKDLNVVLDMLGLYEFYRNDYILEDFNDDNECLNYYVSNSNFRNNSKEIFIWYATSHNLTTYREGALMDVDNDGKGDISVYNCADCGSIIKSGADKIIKLYKLSGMDEYLGEMPEPYKELDYTINYYELSGMHPMVCNIETSHNLDVKYGDNKKIIVTDNQNVVEYEFVDDKVKNEKSQIVTYDFVKDSDGNYYLSNVNVK